MFRLEVKLEATTRNGLARQLQLLADNIKKDEQLNIESEITIQDIKYHVLVHSHTRLLEVWQAKLEQVRSLRANNARMRYDPHYKNYVDYITTHMLHLTLETVKLHYQEFMTSTFDINSQIEATWNFHIAQTELLEKLMDELERELKK